MLGIIIQARMGSSRLPGKVLKKIGDKKLLEHILYRLNHLKHKTKVVIATSDREQDNIIEHFCKESKVDCFRGSEEHVLERYYFCAKKHNLTDIVRLTADNPFIDIEELDNLIDFHYATDVDYSKTSDCLPKGVGSEIFTFEALEKSYEKAIMPHHLEHVNDYILENTERFTIGTLDIDETKRRPDLSLTVDTQEDYSRACYIVEKSSSRLISTQEAIKLCLEYV